MSTGLPTRSVRLKPPMLESLQLLTPCCPLLLHCRIPALSFSGRQTPVLPFTALPALPLRKRSRRCPVSRRAGRPSCTAIDVSLASEGARYDWATQPDSWGSYHLPIIITPVGGKIRMTRQCSTVDWRVFRQRLRDTPGDQDFRGLVAAAAQAATIQSRVPENHPAPDLRHLNLRAARRRAERRYLKVQSPEHHTLFNRVDAVCRRHANRRRRQSWQGICRSLSQARGSSRAWRLLRSLVIGPTARQPVLAVAIRLGISEQELAERLAIALQHSQ
ncbi:hypothetical protein MTO96_045683 [Rhipicephalus appendiculatus]